MTKTLITRIGDLKQYKKSSQTVVYKDPTENRWKNVYGLLQVGDNAIFIATGKLLIGTVTKISNGKSIQCSSIQELICKNDQFLQLHEIFPELISRVKAVFSPFIHPQKINIPQLIQDAKEKHFVSYYVLSDTSKLDAVNSEFKVNDRIVVVGSNNKLENVRLYSKAGLVDFPSSAKVKISVEGFTLDEILEINENIPRDSATSNNVTRIQNIQNAINQSGNYKFKTFFSYHDALFNKRAYGKSNDFIEIAQKILLTNEAVYKVSMGANEVKEEFFNYCNDRSLIIVHKNTKAKGLKAQPQGITFSEQMKIGDYFYMCRGNRNLKIVGKIISDAEECEHPVLRADGWLQRRYEIVAQTRSNTSYTGEQKWWTPNDRSTCIEIPKKEIDEANSKIFSPFFNIEFEYESTFINMTDTSNSKKHTLNQILYGPPGTGKTYNTINKALEILGENTQGKKREQVKELFDSYMNEGRIVFTTFHQNMSYEDFIEGIKPVAPKADGQPVIYQVQDGIFKRLCSSTPPFRANDKIGGYEVVSYSSELLTVKKPNGNYVPFSLSMLHRLLDFLEEKGIDVNEFKGTIKSEDVDKAKYPELEPYLINGYENLIPNILRKLKIHRDNEHTDKENESNKVLIIDEINRGNVSQIFGELIALIEEDKRLGKAEALQAILPYSKDTFGVPANLYIIGTMNTADRSVEALDAALRRRFSFVEMPSNPMLIATEGSLKETAGVLESISLPDVLSIINKRIEKLIDRDHHIGHSYFMSVSNIDELKTTFRNKIIPLLQEYFFGDYGKIGLVLGHGFVEEPDTADENLFAAFGDYDASDFAEKPIYKIKEISNMTDEEFNTAINLLLKK